MQGLADELELDLVVDFNYPNNGKLRFEKKGVFETVREYDLGAMSERSVTATPVPDPVRVLRLREDARRPMSVNLAEGIALSRWLLRFAGVARRG